MSWEDRSESLILRTYIERQIWRDAIPVPLGRESRWRQKDPEAPKCVNLVYPEQQPESTRDTLSLNKVEGKNRLLRSP